MTEELTGPHEVILDANGNALLQGDELLILSKKWKLPYYVKVYAKTDGKLYITLAEQTLGVPTPIPPQEVSVRHMIDNVFDIELTIPLERYEFVHVDDIEEKP